jgi:CheY-like chemotaxis protein
VGTTFRVFFPRSAQSADGQPAPPGPESIPRGSERILLVDDEELLVQSTGDSLEHLGYTVARFTDSRQALKALRENPGAFDCLITDLAMPHLTGTDLAVAARKLRPDLPVILCTGFSQRIDDAKAAAMGVESLVMKPLLRSEMAKALRHTLDLSKGQKPPKSA